MLVLLEVVGLRPQVLVWPFPQRAYADLNEKWQLVVLLQHFKVLSSSSRKQFLNLHVSLVYCLMYYVSCSLYISKERENKSWFTTPKHLIWDGYMSYKELHQRIYSLEIFRSQFVRNEKISRAN
ncbi:uncharacterized protein LOC113360204 [Papaver somniferum]|uniref:uncharacterized protein LOC113360204 n=1 Tax=Papaver somniferum TaxID=3469 RepID=UPI000E6F49F7|nr:uncharacterized protein LOC113360204 [Papaver somniferum]